MSLQEDYENLQAQYEDESEAGGTLRSQITKLTADMQALKGKYDREVMQKTEEIEEIR